MCTENIHIAGRYNKFLRNLSQSPWIDKDDIRIKDSVQELIEEGLNKYLQFDKSVFSSSGREDVDVRMLGKGRPFVFRIVNPFNPATFNQKTMKQIQDFINHNHGEKIHVRDLQVVSKDGVSKNLKDGQESKTKEYRALCCCSRKLTMEDFKKLSSYNDLDIEQKTPIRVLHRRSLAARRRRIHQMKIEEVRVGDFTISQECDLNHLFVLTLIAEAGTYIKEFVHGDFGRTQPSLSSILGDCDTDLIELDVMEVYLDWPPALDNTDEQMDEGHMTSAVGSSPTVDDEIDQSEISLAQVYARALRDMQKAESMPRGDTRQDLYLSSRRQFERARELVESLSIFSDNESIDDIATSNLKYLLIPALLSKITISSECGPNRLETFSRAELLLRQYFDRIVKYGLGDENIDRVLKSDEIQSMASPSLEIAMQNRSDKIERYKKLKMLESRLEELERLIKSGQEVDEEISREYYLSLVKKWTDDSLESLEREIKPGLFFERNRSESSGLPNEPMCSVRSKTGPPQTMTIVKNQLQKEVFGLGYPSRPTVTVDEFIGKKIADGNLAFHAQKEVYANSLQRYAEKPNLLREQEETSDAEREEKEERDDNEELSRKRNWDEFKDENPRGSGNRHNMG